MLQDQKYEQNQSILIGISFGVIAALIWGVFPVVTRQSISHSLSVYDIAALRFLIAGPLLIPVLWQLKLTGISLAGSLLIICGAGAPYLLLAITGLEYAPAAHFGAITPSCMLVFTAIGSWIWLGDKFTVTRIIGTIVIVCGIFVVSWEGLHSDMKNVWVGDVMFIFAGLFWSAYTLALRHWKISALHAIALVSVVSMIIYLPAYFILTEQSILAEVFSGEPVSSERINDIIIQAVYQGIFAVFVALFLYSKAVAILGAAKGAIFGALVPTVALLLAVPILNEIPTTFQILGVILVTLGMLLALGLFNSRKLKP